MVNQIAPAHEPRHRYHIAAIGGFVLYPFRKIREFSSNEIVAADHGGALMQIGLRKVAAKEPGNPRNKYFHARISLATGVKSTPSGLSPARLASAILTSRSTRSTGSVVRQKFCERVQ